MSLPALVICMAIVAFSASAAPATEGVTVTLESPQREYLVGEPVALDTVVRNFSRMDLPICDVPYDGDGDVIEIYISHEGGPFARFAFNQGECVEGRFAVLRGGEALNHPVRLFYSRSRPGGLAFKEAGSYTVKVVFPLLIPDTHSRERIESNSVRIHINAPTGSYAQAWSRAQSDDILDFLQFGDGPHPEIAARTLVRVLMEHPASRYRSSYTDALRRFSDRRGERLLSPLERENFRGVLGVPEGTLFPGDRRLDVSVDEGPSNSTLATLLRSWSERSSVPLTATAELSQRLWSPTRACVVLRDEMEIVAACVDASWARCDEGYILRPNTPPSERSGKGSERTGKGSGADLERRERGQEPI